MDFANIVILVTGASKGIGHTFAELMHQNGATVIGTYNETKIDTDYEMIKCDIRSEEDIKKLFKYIEEHYEKLDVLVNAAAISIDECFRS